MKSQPLERYARQLRAKAQCLSWAQGKPYHNTVDNECCPDFSCCNPDLLEPDELKRWRYYKEHYTQL